MPTLTREKSIPKTRHEAIIAIATEYGELHHNCALEVAHRLKTVAIAVITRTVPVSASESEERDIAVDSLWSALNPRPAADQLRARNQFARIYVYEIKDSHVFRIQETPSLTRIEIALRQLQEARLPFTFDDVLAKAAIATATFMSEYRSHLRRLEAEVALSQRRQG